MRRVVRLVVPVLLLAGLWVWLDGPAAAARLRGARPGWLGLALALLGLQTVLCAQRWRLTSGRLGQPLGLRYAVGEYFLSSLANAVLPGGVLGDAGRAVRAGRGAGLGRSAQAVVIERLAGQVALALLVVAGLLIWPAAPDWRGGLLAVAGGAAVLAVAALRHGPPLLRRFGAALGQVWFAEGAWRAQAALSAGGVLCCVGAFAASSAAIGAPLAPGTGLIVIALTLAAMLVPLSVGGWGLREGAAAMLWPLAGASAEAGLAASIAYGLMALAAALPGVVMLRPAA